MTELTTIDLKEGWAFDLTCDGDEIVPDIRIFNRYSDEFFSLVQVGVTYRKECYPFGYRFNHEHRGSCVL